MRYLIAFLAILLTAPLMAQVKVGDNPNAINNASLFEMESTSRGVLFPRMTLAQRTAITNPPEGLVIFQTDNTPGFYYNASSIPAIPNWKQLITPDAQYWYKNGNNIYPNTSITGNIGIGSTNPQHAGLVVDRKVGAVNAMFGSNTSGVAIESNFPGIAFNTYYNAGRKFIGTGYGGLVGVNPINGNLSMYVTPTDGAADAAAGLSEALTITPGGNIGMGTNTPSYPLTLSSGSGHGFVHTNSTGTVQLGTYVDNNAGWLGTISNNSLHFSTGNSAVPAVTLTTQGYLGIGTVSPVDKLHVTGNARIDGLLKINGFSGTAGQFLVSNGTAAPTWQTVDIPNGPRGIRVELLTDETMPDDAEATISFYYQNTSGSFNDLPGLDNATGIFTCPESGLYQITVHIGWIISGAFTGDKYFDTYLYRSQGAGPMNVIAINTMLTQYNNVSAVLRTQEINTTLKLYAGDRLRVGCEQRSGVTQSITSGGAQTYWNITKLN